MNSDELIETLGERFMEVKRMMSGGFMAYDISGNKSFGLCAKEALQNLTDQKYGYPETKTD